ncbi:ubiquitin-conjugating enzyme/RWD-like protein [Mycena polygramma]|nr:ubiquitin-conjugating enzyme/RWD-like protein [Mycena polygramma]
MHPPESESTSKKRKRSSSSDESSERERASSLIRRSIALLTANPEVPAVTLRPLLRTLSAAYDSALSAEASDTKSQPQPVSMRAEDWDWELSAEQIAQLSEEELTLWKDLLLCRDSLQRAGIKIHPFKWKMPVIDLRQWQAHIPGVPGTCWEGGVYSLNVAFPFGHPERIPHLRFVRPLFHPNVYPNGTHMYLGHPELRLEGHSEVWSKTKQEDPERFANLLRSVKTLIHNPDLENPHCSDPWTLIKNDPKAYEEKIRAQAKAWTPDPRTGLAGRRILQPDF